MVTRHRTTLFYGYPQSAQNASQTPRKRRWRVLRHALGSIRLLSRSQKILQLQTKKQMSLYGWIIVGSISGPLVLSFDRKVAFYKYWRSLLASIVPVAVAFLCWDEYFTINQIWGFNQRYISGIYLGHLPLEEVSFFLIVPYACIFIYEVLKSYFPKLNAIPIGNVVAFTMTLSGLFFGIVYLDNWYTSAACLSAAILTIGFFYVKRCEWYGDFSFGYLVVLLPFLVVNGILTGATTPEPIVWYNEKHIIGIRIYTIPLEDLFYNYAMLLPMTAIFEYMKQKSKR
jgi:lycopene cyclase domain-containing protein